MKIIRMKLLLIVLSTLMFNCGGKEEKKKDGFSYDKTSNSEGATSSESLDDNTIIVTSNDMMQYNVKEIKVKAGTKVRLTLKHIGKLDINVMGHNLVILKQGVNLSEFAAKAATSKDNKYIPVDTDAVIAHTDLIGAGQSSTIEFDAPEAGQYQFLCSFPGHFGLMQGLFIVE